jgi:hypothetical protein
MSINHLIWYLLFGDGANSGLFERVRGGRVKGPVLEIKERLSKQMPVIECSEYRFKAFPTCPRHTQIKKSRAL